MSLKSKADEIVDQFEFYPDWMEKYEHLIELGKSLRPMNPENKKSENLIKGCQAQVWLHASIEDGKVRYEADSDAIITKGIIALLVSVLDGEKPNEIVEADLSFIDKIGLKEHLSPTRSNGLVAMIKQMKLYAVALQATES